MCSLLHFIDVISGSSWIRSYCNAADQHRGSAASYNSADAFDTSSILNAKVSSNRSRSEGVVQAMYGIVK